MVGSLQSQTQDMFSHSMPSISSSTMDTMMNSSTTEPQSNNPLKSLSLNPFMPNSSDMMFNPSTSRTSAGSNSLQMPMGSAYMSATALLQKAAEMGAKVSDDSISPILLRGFTGYSSTPRSLGSVREPSNGPADASEYRHSTFAPLLQIRGGSQGGSMVVNNSEEIVEGRDARMTQDFLGLGPVGSVSLAESSYGENGVGLSYSDGQQGNQHGMYSYQHMTSHAPTAMEKQMWEF